MTDKNSMDMLHNSPYEYDNFNINGYNDTILNDKDVFDIGKLENSDYNSTNINANYYNKPSDEKQYFNNPGIAGDKKDNVKIQYKNNEESGNFNESSLGLFYELDIKDYPERTYSIDSSKEKNKSLGANDNFIIKLINKIKSIVAR